MRAPVQGSLSHAPRPPEVTVQRCGQLKRCERGSKATLTVDRNESSLGVILHTLSGPFRAGSPWASGGLSPAQSN